MRSINFNALSLLRREQRPAVLFELDAYHPQIVEMLREAAAEWDFVSSFNTQALLDTLDFDTGLAVLKILDQLSQFESLSGAAYLIEKRQWTTLDDHEHAEAYAELLAQSQSVQEAEKEAGETRERLLREREQLLEENARLQTQLQAATARTRTARFEQERTEFREQIRTLRDQNKDYAQVLRRNNLLPKDPSTRKVETADGGTGVNVEDLRRLAKWRPQEQVVDQPGTVVPNSSRESQEIARVARRIEAYLKRCGGSTDQPHLSSALTTDGPRITGALRYLEANGRITRQGFQVTLVDVKRMG